MFYTGNIAVTLQIVQALGIEILMFKGTFHF